ncbi:MAG TPA: hypothetical protein VLV17_05540 [Anaeromyxobacteraceae bacterium]|nr:hypothetical protein [Anaeromyxobacteraceae bacterium]
MATRAELFRYALERSGPKKAKLEPRPRGRADGSEGTPHNLSPRAGKHATYAIEVARGKRPSRKSSRKAANRQKNDVQFRLKRATAEVRSESRPGLW